MALLPTADDALHALTQRARALREGRVQERPDGTPIGEYLRSPAASRVGELAAEAGLFSFHFEHRQHLPLPGAWVREADAELAEVPEWEEGVLAEAKYQSFRHDLAIGSFHPHHRPKWSTHELCHGLVGHAWRPDASPFFHATAGRLAELLPVALWYFFDEAFLTRCEDHAGDGDLFRGTCARCEEVAGVDLDDARAEEHIVAGLRYVDRELAAIARSRRTGRVVPHRWATLDLASDGVAYATAHGLRLSHPSFRTWAERFRCAGPASSDDLDQLEARVLDVLRALVAGTPLDAGVPSAAAGRARWIAQDLASRVLQSLAHAPGAPRSPWGEALDALEATVRASIGAHDTTAPLAEAVALLKVIPVGRNGPDPMDVLATGYSLPGHTADARTLIDGVRSGLPVLSDLLGSRLEPLANAFVVVDTWTRTPLATRFASWLSAEAPGALAELARGEAAITTLPLRSQQQLGGPAVDARRRLPPGARVEVFEHDVGDLLARAERGDLELTHDLDIVDVTGAPVEREPTGWVLLRDEEGELVLLDIDPDAADALLALGPGAEPDLLPDEVEALAEHGVLVPAGWSERLGAE